MIYRLPIVTLGELVPKYPRLRPPLIEGLLRQGETMNIIAPPKAGKSWLTYGLALSIASGRHWLDTFPTTPGNVLIVDNELHPETIAKRLPDVAAAMQIHFGEIKDRISILSLRGRLQDIRGLGIRFRAIEPDKYKLIVIDAFYRALPVGTDSVWSRICKAAGPLPCRPVNRARVESIRKVPGIPGQSLR